MTLTLEITGAEGDKLGAARRKTFTEAGGTIGRNPDNHWTLRHQHVSKCHAQISFDNGSFTIEDRDSSNGTFINGSETSLPPGTRHQLHDSDRVSIGPFNMVARVSTDAPQPRPVRDRDVLTDFNGAIFDDLGGGELDPIGLMNRKTPPRVPPPPRDLDREGSFSSEQVGFPPPQPQRDPRPASTGMPGNYVPRLDDSVIIPPIPTPDAPPAVRPAPPVPVVPLPKPTPVAAATTPSPDSVARVFEGLGVSGVRVTPELTAALSGVMRTVIEGLMDFFDARTRFKKALDLEVTVFRARQSQPVNNPLKFSSSCEDAVQKLFVQTPPGYMGPLDSFEDVFDDLRHHQLALAVGIRAGFDAVLKEFDPGALEERFKLRTSGALVAMPASFRYWELYRERFNDMVGEADATFNRLFSEHFAEAYQAELERQKAVARDR